MRLQVALEYMIVFAFVILIFMVIFVTVAKQRATVSNDQLGSQLQLVAEDIASQLDLASQAGNGYMSLVKLPPSGSAIPYSLNITKAGQVIVGSTIGQQKFSAVSYSLAGSVLSNSSFASAAGNGIYSVPIGNGTIALQNAYGVLCVDYSCPNVTDQAAGITLSAQTFHAPFFSSPPNYIAINSVGASNSGTITVWINPSASVAPPEGAYPVGVLELSSCGLYGCISDNGLAIQIEEGTGYPFAVVGSSNDAALSANSVTANAWEQLAIVWQYESPTATSYNLYFNGLPIGSLTSQNTMEGLQTLYVAGVEYGNAFYSGMESNIQYYNTALTQSQLTSLYSGGVQGSPIYTGNLVGWWPLNGNTRDYSGYAKNGTAVGYVPYAPVAQLSATVLDHAGSPTANVLVGFTASSGIFTDSNSAIASYTNQNGVATALLSTGLVSYNGIGTATQAFTVARATAFNGNALTENSLQAWWPLNLGYGTAAYDISGYGADGFVSGASWGSPAFATGFDGSGSYVLAPAVAGIESVSLWLKTGDASQQVFLDGGTCGTGSAYQLALTQAGGVGGSPAINTPGLYFSIGSSNVYIPNYDLANNGWHNIVASWDGGNTVYLGIDGNLPEGYVWDGTSWGSLSSQPFVLPSVPAPANNAILIGRGRCQAAGTGSEYFNGSIANVQIYGVQLTAGYIHRLYVNGIGSPPVGSSGPDAWWPLNGDSIDYSGNVNNGTEINTYISSSNLTAGTNSTTVPISSAHFNGANSLIFLGNTLSLQPESALTVSMWENASAPPSSAASLMLEGVPGYTPGSNTGYSLYLEPPGNVAFTVGQYGTPGSCSASGAANIIDGRVHFIAGVYNTSGIALYIDGAKEAGGACSSSSPINYGIDANGIIGSGSFGGNISNLQIYSTALGQKSIGALYSGGEADFPLQQYNLTGWFPLDGDYGDYSLYRDNAVPSNVAFTAQNAVTASLSHALGGIYGINFNGENGNILLPTMAASNAQTFSAWVYPLNTLGIGGIASEEGTNLLVDNGLACFSVNAIGTGVCSASALPLQAWTFVTGTYNGSAETVYINGMVSNTMALTGSPPGAASGAIGFCAYCPNGGASTYLNGSIADVQIYGTALDRFQAFQLYHSQVPPASSAYLSMSWLP